MKAARAAAAELPNLEGEELRAQQQRVQDLYGDPGLAVRNTLVPTTSAIP